VDRHPNAHASRIKISSVTVDSPVKVPWDITNEFAAYVGKVKHVAVTCHLPHHEVCASLSREPPTTVECHLRSHTLSYNVQESQLLEEQCITDISDPRFDPRVYTEYDITLVKNRMYYLRALDAGLSVRISSAPHGNLSLVDSWILK
jgi:hypothetical protein